MPSPGPEPWSGTRARRCPGCGRCEKYAVRCGGGENHRMGLGDAALVKDNHVAAAGGVAAAVRAVRAAARPGLVIEVECDSVAQVREALEAGARFILLDNMPVPVLREAVAVARAYEGVRLEASGRLRVADAREVASTGVDYLSVGQPNPLLARPRPGTGLQRSELRHEAAFREIRILPGGFPHLVTTL